MNRKIFRATYAESVGTITNDRNTYHDVSRGDKVIEGTAVIIELPGPTRNNCMYPLDEMKKAVEAKMIQDMLNRGALYGEAGHPKDNKDIDRWIVVPMKEAQLQWTKLWFEGNVLMGNYRTYPGNGNLMALSILNGELPAFSIRVLGRESNENGYRTLRDIILITIDWVNYPGNPTSFVLSSKEFQIKDIPLYTHDHYADGRVVAKGESYDLLGLSDNETLISLGEGYFAAVEGFNSEDRSKLSELRRNSF